MKMTRRDNQVALIAILVLLVSTSGCYTGIRHKAVELVWPTVLSKFEAEKWEKLATLKEGHLQFAKSLEYLDSALKYDSTNLLAWQMKAEMLLRLDRPFEAFATMLHKDSLDPGFKSMNQWTIFLYHDSLYSLSDSIPLEITKPKVRDNVDALYQWAQYLNITRGTSESLVAYESVLGADSNHTVALAIVAGEYLHQNRLDESKALNVRSLRLEPLRSSAWDGLASVYAQERRFDTAAALFKVATRLDSMNHFAWGNLANALLHLDDTAGAHAAIRKSISIDSFLAFPFLLLVDIMISGISLSPFG